MFPALRVIGNSNFVTYVALPCMEESAAHAVMYLCSYRFELIC